MADQIVSSYSSLSNTDIFMNAVNANFGDIETFAIPARNTAVQYNAFENTAVWSVFFVGIIPAAFIVTGFVVWTRRRKS